MKILSSFYQPYVVPKPYDFLSSIEIEKRDFLIMFFALFHAITISANWNHISKMYDSSAWQTDFEW